MEQFRTGRREGRYRDHELGDVFLVIDGASEFRRAFDELDIALADIAARGPGSGVHVVVTASRHADVRPQLSDHLATRFELRLNDPLESMFGKRFAAGLPTDVPGRGLTDGGILVQMLVPTAPAPDGENGDAAVLDLVAEISAAWPGRRVPGVRRLPLTVSTAELSPMPGDGIPIGVCEPHLDTLALELTGAEPHLAVVGDSRSGKTTALSTYLSGLIARTTPEQAQIYVVDYRLGLLDVVPDKHLRAYASSAAGVAELVVEIAAIIEKRQPPQGISAAELRARTWWSGPEIYLVIDDYDLVAVGVDNPVIGLSPYLPRGHEFGLHVIVARKVGGIGRALTDPLLGRIKEFGNPALILSGDRNEGALFHDVRASRLPTGRAFLTRLRAEPRLVQIAVGSRQPIATEV